MATKYKIQFTAKAHADLRRLFNYISKELYAPIAAKRVMSAIEDGIRNLADFPLSSPMIDDSFLAKKGYRKLVVESYIVIYKVSESKSTVIIHRIINAKLDYKNIFFNS